METNILFDHILTTFHLGSFTSQPQRVTGGYLHKMYQFDTTTGKYAVKLLNPVIMNRPDALQNFQRAESLESLLQENNIPIVPAMEINGIKMQCVGNQYFYVFQWIEGKPLQWQEISKEHCRTVGTLLAQIHKIKQTEEPFIREKININWDGYRKLADEQCPEIAGKIRDQQKLLYSAQEEFNSALESVPAITCICDSDMDCKNVLWVNDHPFIIDLECLDYGNPFTEMFQLALSWSGGVRNLVDYELLSTFITAYHQEYGELAVDWKALYGIGFGWLEWLEYNIKRALLMECGSAEERELGIGQVHETMERIFYYHSIKEELTKYLATISW